MHRPHLAVLLLCLAGTAAAQQTPEPAPQPKPLTPKPLTLDAVLQPGALRPTLPQIEWIPGTHTLATVRPADQGHVAVTRGTTPRDWQTRFTSTELQRALEAAGAAQVDARKLPPWRWIDAEQVRVARTDGIYHWKVGSERAERVLTPLAPAGASSVAGDDSIGVFVADHDLQVVRRDGRRRRITWDGTEDIVYGGAAHRAEFGITAGLWWDDSGRRLAFSREDQRPIAPYPYADYSTHPPALVHGRYPMAGQAHSVVSVGVYDSADDSVRYLENDPALDLYWTNVTFSPAGDKVFVALVNRGQDHMDLVRFDAATGKREAVLFTERDAEWIEPEHGPQFTPGGGGRFLWFSPRDGYRHLYLYEPDGSLLRQVTSGQFDVAALVGFAHTSADATAAANTAGAPTAANNNTVLVMGSGDNPREMHLWRADLATGAMLQLTATRGWHRCQPSSDGAWVLDSHSNLEQPGALDLVSTRRGQAQRLATAADPLADYDTGKRRFFSVAAADGTTLLGLLLLPPDPDPDRKHPVLQYVYGGPHSQLVRDSWLGGASPWLHHMAARGFVVFVLDNRGTDNRGIEFSQAVFRRLGTLEVADQVRGLEWVSKLPFVDPARVGVHGWSYGGFMTLSLMTRAADRYACGVSGAPVTDWAQYETGYTERYMDTPAENPQGYAGAAVIGRAAALQGRLLLVQGTDDKTVMWSHSMRFLDACIDAGTLPEFMAYPMQRHGLRGADRVHLYRLMTRYLVERLRPEGD